MNAHMNVVHWLVILLLSAGLLLPVPPGRPAAPGLIFQVTKTADTNDGSCDAADCSLREAVIAANATAGADTISVPLETYLLTIPGQNEDAAATGDLDFTDSVIINALGAVVRGDSSDRMLHILPGSTVTVTGTIIESGDLPYSAGNGGNVLVMAGGALVLDNVTIQSANGNDGIYTAGSLTLVRSSVSANTFRGIDNMASGRATLIRSSVTFNGAGGIYNSGQLALISSIVDQNVLQGQGGPTGNPNGGGVANLGTATVQDSIISSNWVTGAQWGQSAYGGGIYSTAQLTITDSTIAGNAAGARYPIESDGYGGGVYSLGALAIRGSMIGWNITGNRSGNGGGLSLGSGSTAAVVNSTISNNTAGWDCEGPGFGCGPYLTGGGIHNAGTLDLNNVTIAGNRTSYYGTYGMGGGIFSASGGTVNFRNTLVGLNRAGTGSGRDCYGTLNSQDYNLIQNTDQCTISGVTTHNITGLDPVLGPLEYNGGPTQTRALLIGSPAIDAGDDLSCAPVDQRGAPRPAGAACDIGAYERDATPPTATPPPTLTPTPVPATSTPTGQAPTDTPTAPALTSTPTAPAPTDTPTPATGTPVTATPTQPPPGAYLPLVLYNPPP